MRLSEIIKQLEDRIKEHGDEDVIDISMMKIIHSPRQSYGDLVKSMKEEAVSENY